MILVLYMYLKKKKHNKLHINIYLSVVPSPPQSVVLGSIFGSPNQLFIVWTPPIPKNGIITAYTVYCNTSANQVYQEQVIGPNIPTIRSVVNGTALATIVNTTYSLIFTQYGCYVTANTSVGEGPPSPTVRSTTCETGNNVLCTFAIVLWTDQTVIQNYLMSVHLIALKYLCQK